MTDRVKAPAVAAEVFGPALELAERYAELLTTTGTERGLLGPREAERVWERHLLNCAVVSELVPAGATVVDVGSGAGLPGLPLAIARPDLTVRLVEPQLRRTNWLDVVVQALNLADRVSVVRSRAEHLGAGTADVVTSRAVAPLSALLPMSARLCVDHGLVLAIKGRAAHVELKAVYGDCAVWGLADAHVALCGSASLEEPTTVVVAHRVTA